MNCSKKDIFMRPLDSRKMHQKRVDSKFLSKSTQGMQKKSQMKTLKLHDRKVLSLKRPIVISEKKTESLQGILFKNQSKLSQESDSKFYKNFLMTKGHLGSHTWTKDMADSLAGIRHGMSFFDAEKTKIACSRVMNFLNTYQSQNSQGIQLNVSEKKTESNSENLLPKQISRPKLDILFVNTSEEYRHLVKKVARVSNQRYINEKWVGGTLTNWSQISQSYSLFGRFHLLFGKFLKRRKIHLPLYEKAQRIYSGLLPQGTTKKVKSFEKFPSSSQRMFTDGLPDIILLINPEENQNVLHEANLLKIPVIALADSNTKVSGIDYMIPGNIQSIEFLYWCLNLITITLQKRNNEKTS